MLLYEYKCSARGARFERIQKFSDPPEAVCPQCGGRGERLLSPPAIQFKGSGWYVTDYARKSAPQKTEGTRESKSETEKPARESKATTESEATTD